MFNRLKPPSLIIYTALFFLLLHLSGAPHNFNASALEKRPAASFVSVAEISPVSSAGQVKPETVFKARFDADLDPSAVNDRNICLTLNNKPVKTVLKYLKNSSTVIIQPADKLGYEKIYSLIFKTGLRGAEGERFKSALMYQYSTISDPGRGAIKIISQFPLAGAEIYDPKPLIFVQFDRPLFFAAHENINDLNDYLTLFDENGSIPSKVRYNRILKRLELTAALDLKNGGTYNVAVSRKARGANNKGLFETFVWQFKAFRPMFYIIDSYPSKHKCNINSYDRILLTFSEPLDLKTDYEEFVKITDSKGASINGKFTVYNVRSLIFAPDFAFYPGSYQLKVSSGLKSYNANRLNEKTVINFGVATDDYNIGEKIREN
jgi:hypothetical protein